MRGSATLVVGYVSRAHGIAGELAVRPFDPASQALDGVERVVLRARDGQERNFEVIGSRPASREVLLTLASVEGRSAAEALQGSTVLVYREDLEPPAEGEFFQGDLVGLRVLSPEGQALGTVAEVWNAGPVPTLVIRGDAGELLVPFAEDFVPKVDLEAGVILVRPMELFE
ncbi:MAG: ribosome maturation factor RimM [Myxococcaceae bacterium]